MILKMYKQIPHDIELFRKNNKPKELIGLDQNGKWVGRRPVTVSDTGETPTGR